MIPREATAALLKAAQGYPVIAITGPHQAGKTTLSRLVFPDKTYVSLEDPDQLSFALSDPHRFLQGLPEGAIFDEIQRAPALFSYIQRLVDERREPSFFGLTGSQHFDLLAQISQTLAGRVALLELLPFPGASCRRPGSVLLRWIICSFKDHVPRCTTVSLTRVTGTVITCARMSNGMSARSRQSKTSTCFKPSAGCARGVSDRSSTWLAWQVTQALPTIRPMPGSLCWKRATLSIASHRTIGISLNA